MMLPVFFIVTGSAMAQTTKVLIQTSKGDITVVLYDDTPKHRDNFIKLVEEAYYNDVLFHRVISQFMVQAGDPDSKNANPGQMLGNGGPGYTIEAEFNDKYFHKKGALAAARTGDNINPEKRSSGSQFYIVQGQVLTDMQLDAYEKRMGTSFSKQQRDAYCTVGGAPHLDGAYTVFGEVTEGLHVIDKIAGVVTDKQNRPLEDVRIISMKVINK
ncbi:MAG TPA: peptidylprolyl isomerase [Bacteroidales bacterium]|nr:peptidylprolyl isomerase [Bacteroidales bacterium]